MRVRRFVKVMVSALAGFAVGTAGFLIMDASQAEAASQVAINKFIRANRGVVPCTHEDGSGQPGTCVWWAGQRGNSEGYSYLVTSNDQIIYITGPKAKRY